jgi:hypothetical protein
MSQRAFSIVAGIIFLIVALAHLCRLILGWHITIANLVVPLWISWIALVIAAFLAWQGLKPPKIPK